MCSGPHWKAALYRALQDATCFHRFKKYTGNKMCCVGAKTGCSGQAAGSSYAEQSARHRPHVISEHFRFSHPLQLLCFFYSSGYWVVDLANKSPCCGFPSFCTLHFFFFFGSFCAALCKRGHFGPRHKWSSPRRALVNPFRLRSQSFFMSDLSLNKWLQHPAIFFPSFSILRFPLGQLVHLLLEACGVDWGSV